MVTRAAAKRLAEEDCERIVKDSKGANLKNFADPSTVGGVVSGTEHQNGVPVLVSVYESNRKCLESQPPAGGVAASPTAEGGACAGLCVLPAAVGKEDQPNVRGVAIAEGTIHQEDVPVPCTEECHGGRSCICAHGF